MKTLRKLSILCIMLTMFNGLAQTVGLIYKPAGNALGKSVLDPNGDGFASPTLSGFSGTDYGTGSELQMIALPVIIDEPLGDLTTGSSGGHTDIVTNSSGSRQSCYVLVKNVGGIDYLIVRFRMGGNSTSPKAYSLLLDTDGSITNNYTTSNPGFEREIVLSATNSVAIYSHNGSGATLLQSYNVDNYQQRSVALSTVSGNADYFYDFFVPLSAVNAASAVRMAAITVNSLASGLSGTISDINGVNDTSYSGNHTSMFQAEIAAFPPITLALLTTGFSFPNIITSTPVVTSVLTTASTSITGTSQEANGTTITVYKNGISIGTTTVTSNAWTLTGVSGLVAGNLITAKATATGKNISAVSNTIEVSAVQACYTPAPTNLVRNNGQIITGNYVHASGGTIAASTVRIRLYEQVNATTFTEINAASTVYVATNGTWSFSTGLGQSVFNTTSIVATATFNSCVSGYSVVNKKTSGQVGSTTATPTMVTTQIIASPSIARSVQVTNNNTTASNLILYINGYQVAISPTTIASGASYTFSYTGFIEGDIVTARAQSATVDYWLSNPTTAVIVIASATPTTAPVITGTYTAGSGKTVTGTSIEISGTVITLYKAGTTLLGTTTVNSFGNWSVTGLTLATNDVLTAYAKATVKTLSLVSNSVTVAASVPTAPSVTSPITAGQTTISGTGGLGTITVYVDGSTIGTTTGASWTLSSINPLYVYRGGVVTATNTVSGIPSVSSNQVTIQGVVSFCITDTSGNPISTKLSEDPFSIRITAMSGANCTGSVFTSFTGTVTISSSTNIISGGGTTASFVNGVLTTSIALGNPGTGVTINVVNTSDPTATGTTSLNVTPITAVVSSDQTICSGTAPANLTLATNLSTIVKWQKSSDTLFTSPVDIANNTATLTGASIGNLTATTYFRAVLLTGSSSTVYSNYITITFTPISVGGTVSGSATVCTGTNSTTVTLSVYTGSITKWQSSTVSDFSSGVTDIANTSTSLTATNLTATLYYRAVVTNGVCTFANSSIATVTVNQVPTATAGGSQTICQTGTATVSGASSTNGTRLWTHNGAGSITNATTLTPTYTAAAGDAGNTVTLTMTVTNSPCTAATATYTVNVSGTPTATAGGSQTICQTGTATVSGASSTNGTRLWTHNGAGSLTNATTLTPTYTAAAGDAGNTVTLTMTVTNSPCTAATATYTVNVSGTPTATAGGSQTICQTGTATVSGASSTNGTRLWTHNGAGSISNATTLTPTYTALAGDAGNTVTLTMTVTNSPCTAATATYTVNVNANSVGGTVTGGTATCLGTTSGLLTLSGHTGIIVRWEYSVSPFTSWTTIANTSTTCTSGALTQTTQFRAVIQSGVCSEANSAPTTVTISSTTWNGSSWSNSAPTSATAAVFTGNYTATSDIAACTITVSNNAVVVIPSSFTVTINGAITVNTGSSFTLNNNANLLQLSNATNIGNIVVKRNSSALLRLDYTLWSSPVTSQNLLAFSPLTLTNRFYTYNTSTNIYDAIASPSTTNFATAKGYLIRVPNNYSTVTPTIYAGQFTGVPNNGDYTFTMVNGGAGFRFNAIGNPYPSPVDAENFVNANSSNITGTLYYWRKTNNASMLNSYCTWTTAGFVSNGEAQVSDTNGIIRTGQGFFVEALNSATTVNFTNSMRVNDTANQFLRAAPIERHRVWLNATNTSGAFSQMLVGYMAGATNGVDPRIDGRYINDGVIALNSLISNVQYTIQGRALPFTPTDVVPLSFTATTTGSYTIAIDHVDGIFTNPNKKVYLKDNQTNTRHDLRLGSYTFTATSGTTASRFELVFQTTYYQDLDGDSYGNNAVSQLSDTQPIGYVLNNTDCDDTNGFIHATFSFYADTDLDGYGTGSLVSVCAVNATTPPTGYSLNNTDCSPTDGLTYQSDTVYVDADADSYTVGSATLLCYGASLPAGYSVISLGSDCDDTIAAINPGHAEVLYNGVDDNCDGNLDEGFQLTTTMQGCGTTLTSIGSLMAAVSLGAPITGYRFEVTRVGSLPLEVQVVNGTGPNFSLTQLPSYAYATTYSIRVMLQRSGVWLGYYGASCNISSPAVLSPGGATSVTPSQCGVTLPTISTLIATTSLAGATGYKFKVTNQRTGFSQELTRTLHWFSLTMLTQYNYGDTYMVEVAIKTTGAFSGYGSPCNVTAPAVSSLTSQCGTTIPTKTTNIVTSSLALVTSYDFEVRNETTLATANVSNNLNWFRLNMLPNYSQSTLFRVRVRVLSSGVYSDYSDACFITSPAVARTVETLVNNNVFEVTASPNPFDTNFGMFLNATSTEDVTIRVYDMIGKLIEQREVKATEVITQEVGNNYPSGVYNVIVSQGTEAKTLRVIKR